MKHPTKIQYNYANIWYNTQEDERGLKRRIIISEPRTAWLSGTVVKQVGMDAVKADVAARIYADSIISNHLQTDQQNTTCQNANG